MAQDQKIDIEKADSEVLTFLELLLAKKGMGGMPAELVADMLIDLYSRFENFLLLSVMQKMDPEKYANFDAFLETNPTPEDSQKFMEENVDNLSEAVRGAMDEFAKIYLQNH